MARMTTRPTAGYSTGTITLTVEEQLPSAAPSNPSFSHPPQNVVLRLRVPKKKVTWREGTVDNEFLNRKSSKKCCIFHKQKSFDEDDSEEEDDNCGGGRRKGDDYDGAGTSGCCHHDGLERRSN